MIDVTLYNATVVNPLVEAELLVDGVQVGPRSLYPSGTGTLRLVVDAPVANAGLHRVAIRVVQQRYPSVAYSLLGTILAINSSTNAIVRRDFPASATLKAGDQVEVSVNVP